MEKRHSEVHIEMTESVFYGKEQLLENKPKNGHISTPTI